jgi:hypothetical protein
VTFFRVVGSLVLGSVLVLAGVWYLTIGQFAVIAFLVSTLGFFSFRERHRDGLRARSADLRRVGDDDREPGDAWSRAAGLNSWMRGGRS